MTLVYRTSDLTRWGSGLGADLSPTQVDLNFWQLLVMIQGISATTPVGIASFSVSGQNFYVNMTDASTRGPYALPLTSWTFRGPWASGTAYYPADVITNAGAVYLVLLAHTSATTFSAGANDGSGHNYYGLLVPPSIGVPAAGTTGQVLAKLSNTDYNTGWTSAGVPLGGSIHQVLGKNSGTDLDTAWITPVSTGVPAGGGTGEILGKNSNTDYDTIWVMPPFSQLGGICATSYTLVLADAWTVVQGQGVPGTITIPLNSSVAFPIGTMIIVVNADVGSTIITGAGGVLLEPSEYPEFVLEDFRAFAILTKVGTDIWMLNGQFRPIVDTTPRSGTQTGDLSHKDIIKNTPSADTTYNNSSGTVRVKPLTFIFTTSGTVSYTITFGTNFISQGPLATGVVSGKTFIVRFMGDGTNYIELGARGAAM